MIRYLLITTPDPLPGRKTDKTRIYEYTFNTLAAARKNAIAYLKAHPNEKYLAITKLPNGYAGDVINLRKYGWGDGFAWASSVYNPIDARLLENDGTISRRVDW